MINRILLIATFISLLFSSKANAFTNPVKADIVVALDGSGQYKSIQAAIDAVPDNSSKRITILIKNGTYNTEKLIVPATKTNLSLLGEDREKTIISYHVYDCKSPAPSRRSWPV